MNDGGGGGGGAAWTIFLSYSVKVCIKLRCEINPISHDWLLEKNFILSKGNFI